MTPTHLRHSILLQRFLIKPTPKPRLLLPPTPLPSVKCAQGISLQDLGAPTSYLERGPVRPLYNIATAIG